MTEEDLRIPFNVTFVNIIINMTVQIRKNMRVSVTHTAYPNGKVKHHKQGMEIDILPFPKTSKYNKWIENIYNKVKK